jgi:hypothetical protein
MANEPTRYDLYGGGITVSYTPANIAGQPLFSYHDATQTKNFTGKDQIHTESTVIGTLVTVFLMRTIDGPSTSFSLLLPAVRLPPSNSTPITTEGITTLHRGTFIGPPTGQIQSYTVVELQGTAAFAPS